MVLQHKSVSVLPGYVRSAEIFDDHAGAGFLEVAGMGEASTKIRGRQGEHGCGQVADQAESQRGCDGGLFVRALSLKLGF
ncbi:hypothetical protein [Sphingomonas sp. SRS2]|uniref:hypothetical protein n=1 Tax=Sphingomonas sp. SRS2 TaxID=133190 RepID=UPI001910EEC0|nr:hypothetical protein [Sphingomonas sp. SRS2]